jgi:antitoxin component YwqK of YwqJK toxin-antitoxin module
MNTKHTIAVVWAALLLTACNTRHEVQYYPTGEVEVRAPLDERGRFNGDVKSYYKSGVLKSVSPHVAGRPEGLTKWYSPTGELESVRPYRNGKTHGTVQRYYPTGKWESWEQYRNGRLHGKLRQYFPSGQLKYAATQYGTTYRDTAYYYYPTGAIRQIIMYDSAGRKVDYRVLLPNGQVDEEYTEPLWLTDGDTITQGQDYAFEVVLANRRFPVVRMKMVRPRTGVDTLPGVHATTQFVVRRPAPGPHTLVVQVLERWQRKSGDARRREYPDTLWRAGMTEHTFWVRKAPMR